LELRIKLSSRSRLSSADTPFFGGIGQSTCLRWGGAWLGVSYRQGAQLSS
jgi:hypothetical protein